MPIVSEVLDNVMDRVFERSKRQQPLGLTSGFPELDRVIGEGWARQELTYLVGDSGVGKSWLATWFMVNGAHFLFEKPDQRPLPSVSLTAEQNAEHNTRRPIIVFWSMEMGQMPVIVRIVSLAVRLATGVSFNSADLRMGEIGCKEGDANFEERSAVFRRGYGILKNWGKHMCLDFDDRSVEDFAVTLERLSVENDIVMVIIDYFRRISEFDSDGSMAMAQEVRSMQLAELAKEFDTHVFCIFDVTKLGQTARRVHAEHMKGGTAAQYDADLVLTMNLTSDKDDANMDSEVMVDLAVEKNRYGDRRTFRLMFDKRIGYFSLAERQQIV